jgi:TPR repeat protein
VTRILCLALCLSVGALESARGDDYYTNLENRPVPTDDAQRNSECALIVSEEARQKSNGEILEAMEDKPSDAALDRLLFNRILARLQARYVRIRCGAVPIAPAGQAPPQSADSARLEDARTALYSGDCNKAFKAYGALAAQGNADAQFYFAKMYDNGWGTVLDAAQALAWYQKSANQGQADAQFYVGLSYEYGPEASRDPAAALAWYRKAAAQGQAAAQSSVGLAYLVGKNVPADNTAAAMWITKAADQGDSTAQAVLANLYRNGKAVPQDYVQSHKWFNLAASRTADVPGLDPNPLRVELVKLRDKVAAKMTPAQIAEAQKLATEWTQRMATQPPRTPELGRFDITCKYEG